MTILRKGAGPGAEAPLYPNAQSENGGEGPSGDNATKRLLRTDGRGYQGSPDCRRPANGGRLDDRSYFWAFVKADELRRTPRQLRAAIEYPLERVEKGQLNWRVEKMRLGKDKTSLVYNEFLTLRGIPPETYEYRLGNRSALEWIIDQYQVSTDKRSGITNDPNRADDPEYIVRLMGRSSPSAWRQ